MHWPSLHRLHPGVFMPFSICTLHQLGWQPRYAHDLNLDDFEAGYPARVVAEYGDHFVVASSCGRQDMPRPRHSPGGELHVIIGDWLLLEHHSGRLLRVLPRQSLFAHALFGDAGPGNPVVANLDTLFVVTSCDEDFNVTRVERHLARAFAAAVTPVVVMTKADRCPDASAWLATAQRLLPQACVVLVNATEPASVAQLDAWLVPGNTLAMVGSPGVGKAALMRHWLDDATAALPQQVVRRRHAGVAASMLSTRSGAWIIDTVAMHALRRVVDAPMQTDAAGLVTMRAMDRC